MSLEREYYLLTESELMDYFKTSKNTGLPLREVQKRWYQYGLNQIINTDKRGIIVIFLSQFKDFMILVLAVATFLSLLMGEISDAFTILAIIILNGVMGFIQEYRAEKSLAALKKLTAPTARVIRDKRIEKIEALKLVPGDIILLDAGDRVPADCRIIGKSGLQVDESILTGESQVVNKSCINIFKRGIKVSEQHNMLFMGTTITRGRTRAVVVATGMDTEMGKIAEMLDSQTQKLTPLQRKLKQLGKWLVLCSIIITSVIVILGIIQGQSVYKMVLTGITLAVAAIPEGLPAIVTLVLALGVQKMIKNNAIVRKLQAVETLGCSTVICSDKTGTLTKNEMVLKKIFLNNRIIDFSGDLNLNGLEKFLEIGAVCSTVQINDEKSKGAFGRIKKFFRGKETPVMTGDPTEIALLKAIYEQGMTYTTLMNKYIIVGQEDFDSQRKRMSVIVEYNKANSGRKRRELWIKGAPEVILKYCKFIEINKKIKPITKNICYEIKKASEQMASDALRVLGFAYKRVSSNSNNPKEHEKELIFSGLAALMDPPRPEAYQAVNSAHQAGVRTIMITGDHQITAGVIAKELGIISGHNRVITGAEINNMKRKNLKKIVAQAQVFARVLPEDKLKIVKALRDNGEIVAMTGDGVNDAPAIKEADIGIAMGDKGTDVSREASSLILADDNFATIVKAIEEGRKIYNNIRKFIRYLLACNIGELLAIFIGVAMGLPLPLLPIQILWVNLVTDGLPALALGIDNDSDQVMKKPPRDPDERIFDHGMISSIISQGTLIGISTVLTFIAAIYRLGLDINTARTMAFSTLVFSQLIFVFSCRSEKHSLWELSPFENIYLAGAVLFSSVMHIAVIYWPFLSNFFRTVPLGLYHWIIVCGLSFGPTIIADIIRNIFKNE